MPSAGPPQVPWPAVRIGDLCEKITDGTHRTPKYVREGVPFISTANLVPFRPFKFDSYTRFISIREHRLLIKRCNPEPGDLLVAKIGTLGLTKLVDVEYEFSVFVGLALLKLRDDLVVGEFLEQVLNTAAMVQKMVSASPGSTRATLTIREIAQLEVLLPPLSEQRRIAELLGTVDEPIRRTEQVIAKLRQIKQGLASDLLTRGIDDHGELRDPERHPEQFKDSFVGRIPVSWRTGRILDVVDPARPVTYGIVQPGARQEHGVPIIRGQDYSNGTVATGGLYLVHPSVAAPYRRSTVTGGDLLLSIVGYVGQTAQVPSELTGANLTQTTARIAIRKEFVARFFLQLFRGPAFRQEISRYTKGSAQPGLNLADVEQFRVTIPPVEEQRRISMILDTADRRMQEEASERQHLESVKRGLLDDLLTGKVRVSVEGQVA